MLLTTWLVSLSTPPNVVAVAYPAGLSPQTADAVCADVKPPEDNLTVITAPFVPLAPRTTIVTSSAPAASAASGTSRRYTPGILVASTSAKPPEVHACAIVRATSGIDTLAVRVRL